MEIGVGKTQAPWVNDSAPVRPKQSAMNHEIVAAVQAANRVELLGEGSQLAFRFDRETQQQIIEVRDKTTNEVIRQLPPENLLRVMQSLLKANQGRDSLE